MSLHYRPIERTEADSLATWLSGDTWPYFLGRAPTKGEILKRIADGEFFGEGSVSFWIFDSGDRPIGLIELYQLGDLAPMFSLRFKSEARRRGHGKPAVDWLTRHVFETYPEIRRIEAQTREDNVPMRKVFNRAGYTKEAYYRMASPTEDGGRVASIVYGILREDWASGTRTPVAWPADAFFDGDQFR